MKKISKKRLFGTRNILFCAVILFAVAGLFLSGCKEEPDDPPVTTQTQGTPAPTAVTFDNLTQNGNNSQTTTQLTLTFSQAITGLSAGNITVSGVTGVTKGTLSSSGANYYLPISGFSVGGTLNVAVSKNGYAITPSSKEIIIYYNSGTPVTFDNLTQNGSSTQTTTQLTLTFSQAITGLSASDITFTGVVGVTKGTLTGSGPSYTLPISGFASSGNLTVAVSKDGYTITGSPKQVTIYQYTPPVAVTFNSVTANGSSSQTTTQLTLNFSQAVPGLSAGNITVSGVTGVTKGTLSSSGANYYLPISGFTENGTLSVTVASIPGYTISGSPKTADIYYVLPDLTGAVTITGTPQVGYSLTANISNLKGSGTISYQWKWGNTDSTVNTDISGATSQTYSPDSTDVGKYISVTVTRAGNDGSITADTAVGPVVAAPVTTDSLAITITLSDSISKETVTFTNSGALNLALDGELTVTVNGTYQFYRWFIDSIPNDETTSSLTLNGSNYLYGTTHRILVIVYKNGVPYSQDINFTVGN